MNLLVNSKLHKYQKEGRDWILSHNGAGLFLDPGLGKTLITLSALDILFEAKAIDRVIIVAPLRVIYMVWKQEAKKWGFNFDIAILHGPDKDTIIRQKHDIYLINPEGLSWFINTHGQILKKHSFMLVIDESTMFKNHSSMRFRAIKVMLSFIKRRVILTGTPAPNGLLQLWSQIFILDGGKRLGKNITAYRRRWFMPNYNGFGYSLMYGMEKQVYDAIDDIVMHKSSDELDLPELLFNSIKIEVPLSSKILYNNLKKESIAILENSDQMVTAINAATQGLMLKQIANGTIYGEAKSTVILHNEKINAVLELVESLAGQPLIVVYEFNHDKDRLKAALNSPPHIGGGVSGEELTKIVGKWNAGELPVLLIQPQAGGHGLNLQDGGCHNIVWFSIPFDLELYDQANARVHRQGVKNSVTIHHIVAVDTIDERILDVLEKKGNVQNALLQAMLK